MTPAIRTAPTAPGGGVEAREIERRTAYALQRDWSGGRMYHDRGHGSFTRDIIHADFWPTAEAAAIGARNQRNGCKVVEVEIIAREVTP